MGSSVGELLRRWRRDAGLTQENLAAEAQLSVEAISALERGARRHPHPATVDLLVDALSLSEDQRRMLTEAGRRGRRHPQDLGSELGSRTPPRQLPWDVDGFSGREEELAELDGWLAAHGDGPGVPIVAVTGTGGVGKSGLAVHWAHRVASQFPDGQLWIDLRGFDAEQPIPVSEALGRFLRALGIKGGDVPADTDERAALYRSVLADKRMLVVVDNARDSEPVRDLLPGSPSCLTVVTSRDGLSALVARDGAHRLDLDALPLHDAVALLETVIGDRAVGDPDATAAVGVRCGRLPLALRIAAELAVAHPKQPLSKLAADLRDVHGRLDRLSSGTDRHTALRAVFSWSYQQLAPDTARAFRLLGLCPGPDIDSHASAALFGTTVAQAEHMLDKLTGIHLVQEPAASRYAMHDLLRAWAIEQSAVHDEEGDREAALRRLYDHYRYAALIAMNLYAPSERDRRPLVQVPATTNHEFADRSEAASWLDAERINLVDTVVHAAEHGSPQYVTDLSTILFRYLYGAVYDSDAERLHGLASRVAEGAARARALNHLGSTYSSSGRYQEAIETFEAALGACVEVDDHVTELPVLNNLGKACQSAGRYADALEYLEQAYNVAGQVGNRRTEGNASNLLGSVLFRLGRHDEAVEYFKIAVNLARQARDGYRECIALLNLSEVDHHHGRYSDALEKALRCLAMARELGDRGLECNALNRLGVVYVHLERYPEALAHHEESLALARKIRRRTYELEVLNDTGATLGRIGRPQEALDCHHDALVIAQSSDDRYEWARAYEGLGNACRELGKDDQATEQWNQALNLYEQLGVPEADDLRTRLA